MPLVHIDTGHNFETLEFRDNLVQRLGANLIVGSVQKPSTTVRLEKRQDITLVEINFRPQPLSTPLKKTRLTSLEALEGTKKKPELGKILHRDDFSQWDPKNQRPELWNY